MKSIIIVSIVVALFSPLVVFAEESSLTNTILSPKEIPTWIKNTAGWWSEDKISDREFLTAINYLKESYIIHIPTVSEFNILNNTETIIEIEANEGITKWHSSVFEAIDNPSKSSIIFPKISGQLDRNTSKIPITITITKPNEVNTLEILTLRGKYSTTIESNKNNLPGIYSIEIRNDKEIIETKYAFLDGVIEKIPVWIKNNAGWWASGQLSDDDFVSGIQFLVKKEMMKSEIKNSLHKENPNLVSFEIFKTLEQSIFSKTSLSDVDISQYATVHECRTKLAMEGKNTSVNLQKCKKITNPKMEEWTESFSDQSYSALDSIKYQSENVEISPLMEELVKMRDHRGANPKPWEKSPTFEERKKSNQPSHYGGYSEGYYSTPRNFDYSAYSERSSNNFDYSGYGINSADVEWFSERMNYYGRATYNSWVSSADNYVDGKISHGEYERQAISASNYYGNQLSSELDMYLNSQIGHYP
jgi:hypothetical protein